VGEGQGEGTNDLKDPGLSGGTYEADFLVDTGATDSLAPGAELKEIGVQPMGKMVYELADGMIHEGEILPVPPLSKEGTQMPPFQKGAAQSAGGFRSITTTKRTFASRIVVATTVPFFSTTRLALGI
jgi:hypothetical protein